MATFTKFNKFVEDLATKKHDLSADTLKIALTNVAPSATNSVFADITEITAGNGYTAGGQAVGIGSATQTGGTFKLTASGDVVFTASGGNIPTFRYAVLYNATATGNPLIGYYDRGATVDLLDGDTYKISFTSDILTLV
jgi:hypothetical protein